MSKWDHLQEGFKEKVNDLTRMYPKATYAALVNFISQIPDTKPSIQRSQTAMNSLPNKLALEDNFGASNINGQ